MKRTDTEIFRVTDLQLKLPSKTAVKADEESLFPVSRFPFCFLNCERRLPSAGRAWNSKSAAVIKHAQNLSLLIREDTDFFFIILHRSRSRPFQQYVRSKVAT